MSSTAPWIAPGTPIAGASPLSISRPAVGAAAEPAIALRRARLDDVGRMATLLDEYARRGLVLPRPIGVLFRHVREFVVATASDEVVGCGALRVYSPVLAEIGALAVAERCQGRRVGRCIVEALVGEARSLGTRRVFALTLQEPFFHRLGFRTVPMSEVPEKIAADRDEGIDRAACMKITVVRDLED